VSSFRYLRDPLFLLGLGACLTNQGLIKPMTDSAFFHNWFNDFWLIPAALPPVLWLQARLGWRAWEAMPSALEIGVHLLVWSIICEGIGPALTGGRGDGWDVMVYGGGAVAAGLWWNRDCWWKRGGASVGRL
jgi:hypothetical protein